MNPVMTNRRHRQTNAAFTVSREHDVLDRVTDIVYAARDGTPLYRLSYAYDPDGLATQRVVAASSGVVTNSYAYDGLMRLVAESDSHGNSASYVYDLCGNRLSVTDPSGTVSSTYTHNRRDADTYDAGGRVTRTVNGCGQVLDLAWNLQGELVSVSTNGVFAEGYAYDPMGRRISTTDANGTVYHAYDGIHCVADLALDGTLLRSYTWGVGIDNLLAVTLYGDSTNTLYAVTDPLGTVHALVGTNGVPAVTYAYDSWGNLLSVSGDETLAASLRFAWQGRECSHATALYNFRARWYDPASGRWLSKDPIGLEGGLNLYEAFGNNPVCFGDPSGNLAFNFGFSFAAGGGNGIAFSVGLVGGTSKDGGFKLGGFVTGATGSVVGLGAAATIIGGMTKGDIETLKGPAMVLGGAVTLPYFLKKKIPIVATVEFAGVLPLDLDIEDCPPRYSSLDPYSVTCGLGIGIGSKYEQHTFISYTMHYYLIETGRKNH